MNCMEFKFDIFFRLVYQFDFVMFEVVFEHYPVKLYLKTPAFGLYMLLKKLFQLVVIAVLWV